MKHTKEIITKLLEDKTTDNDFINQLRGLALLAQNETVSNSGANAGYSEGVPPPVNNKTEIIKILANMLLGCAFPSTCIEDHPKRITRKYIQNMLTNFDDTIKNYAVKIKEAL
jgi:hypothetical protein